MGIFTANEMLFGGLGAMAVLLALGFIQIKKLFTLDWKAVTVAMFGMSLTLFCVAWSVSSVIEGEPQAATMGVLLFGIPGLLSLGIFCKMLTRKEASAVKSNE